MLSVFLVTNKISKFNHHRAIESWSDLIKDGSDF